jgi:Bax protein
MLKKLLLLLLATGLFAMTVAEKKQRFRDLLEPAVIKVYDDLDKQFNQVKTLLKTDPNNKLIKKLMKDYHASSSDDLLKRLKPHPKSIAMAQAAMESNWATSRFTKVANNLFGVWSFNPNEPRVPALQKRGNKTIYVKKYKNVEESIRDYYKVLATSKAFKEFRDLKMKTDNPYELVKKLDKYSEKGAKYGVELSAVIKYNHFDNLDKK